MRFRDLPIRRKVSVSILLMVAAAVCLASAGILLSQKAAFQVRAESALNRAAIFVSSDLNSTFPVTEENLPAVARAARQTLGTLCLSTETTEACVFTEARPAAAAAPATRKLLASVPDRDELPPELADWGTGFHRAPDGVWLITVLAARDGSKSPQLCAALRFPNTGLQAERARALTVLAGVAAILLVLAGWIINDLHAGLVHPLSALAATVQQIAEKRDHSLRVRKASQDEIGSLADNINRMLGVLEAQAEALRVSEERYRLLIENSNELVAELNPAGWFLYASPNFKSQLGWEATDLQAMSFFDQVHPTDLADFVEQMAQPVASTIHRFRHKDGSWHWLETLSRRFAGTFGDSRNVVVARDVTERVKTERALQDRTAELDRFFNASLELLCIADVHGHFRRLNPLWEETLGYSLQELEGRRFLEFVHPDDLASTLTAVEQLAQQKTVTRFVNRYRRKDGTYRWLEWSSFPSGETIHAVTRDITERKRAEAALMQSERNYREIFNGTSEAIFIHDLSGAILDVNRSTCELFGYNRAELLVRTVADVSSGQPPHSQAEAVALIRRAAQEGPQMFEWRSRRHNGEEFWSEVALHSARVLGQDCVIAGVRDITDRKKAQEQVYRLNAELEQRVADRTAQLAAANKELESFSYSVSHDLRAPLRAIEGFSQALAEDCEAILPPEGKDHLRRVRAATVQMASLIDDLLELARMSRAELCRAEVNLSALAAEILGRLHETQPERKAEVYVTNSLVVQADPILMRVALENLFSNAWKYTGKKPAARIEFGRMEVNGQGVFYVRDNGAGFDMTYATKLFGAFQRLHSPRDFEGTGVGLATVQRILHRHGGRIWAEAQPDHGATFYFTVPSPVALTRAATSQ